MPVCPQCDNRQFSNKEALMQHIRSSSAYHPFCDQCDRRFVSRTAHDAHMAAKHPPTFDCTLCNRPYHAPFALEDHYRGSSLHPNCTKCGRGFRDQTALDEHQLTAHIKVPCAPCGGMSFYEDELNTHYWHSPSHPKCQNCKLGLRDDDCFVEHMSTSHPEQHCALCNASFERPEGLQMHFWTSPLHPKCDRCNMGFLNTEAQQFHLETVHTPTTGSTLPSVPESIEVAPEPAKMTEQSIFHQAIPLIQSISQNHTGFTPLSPRNPMQSLIIGERRVNSPDLHLDVRFSPIIEAKPPFSPALPRPGHKIEEIWSSTENVQIPPARLAQVTTPPRSSTNIIYGNRIGYYPLLGTNGSALSEWNSTSLVTREPRRPSARLSPPGLDFHSRLYPGSVRAASLNSHGIPTESNIPVTSGSHRIGAPSISGSLSHTYPTYTANRRPRATRSEIVDWEELMGVSPFEGASANGDAPSPTTAVCASPAPPTARLGGMPQYLAHSPSLATVTASSPASSALGHSPVGSGTYEMFSGMQADTRPTTASSTPSHTPLGELAFTVTPTSECPSPICAPDLNSPVSPRSLPSMSPLAGTPIDIKGYDIDYPEAQQPLPDSPTHAPSPITVLVDIYEPTSVTAFVPLEAATASPLSTSSARSYITSPQEPAEVGFAASPAPAPAPAMRVLTPTVPPHQLETAALEAAFDLIPGGDDDDGQLVIPSNAEYVDAGAGSGPGMWRFDTVVASPVTPISREGGGEAETGAEGAVKTSRNPLHCRACLADSCDDITASMCGHIFCNRCITDAVIKTSRCPVCSTPTLLYCLFRLDLAA